MSSQQPVPQDFELKALNLINAKGDPPLDIHHMMVELNTFESLFNTSISGWLTINDAKNLLSNYPIFGFDRVQATFATPNREEFKIEFYIYKVSDRKLIKEREQIYILHLIAKEQVDDCKVRVSKSYKGQLISDVVTDLHTNWLKSAQPFTVESTQFMHHIVIPNLHPIQAINWLATRATPASWQGSNYLYYQDKHGFNFVTGEKLLCQKPVTKFTFQPANARNQDANTQYKPRDPLDERAMIDWNFDSQSDILNNLDQGMYGNELLTHDPTNKQWHRYTFDYPQSYGSYQHLTPNMLFSAAWPDGRNSPAARMKFHSEGQEPFPFKPSSWLPMRISQMQQLNNIIITMSISGHSTRTVGEVVTLQMPSPEPPVDGQQLYDPYHQGKYLIATLRHKINQDSFTTTMTLLQDSVFSQYP